MNFEKQMGEGTFFGYQLGKDSRTGVFMLIMQNLYKNTFFFCSFVDSSIIKILSKSFTEISYF